MKRLHLFRVFVSLFTACATAAIFAKAEEHGGHSAPPAHHLALAEHLARTEAHVRAIDRHISIAAERRVHEIKDVRVVERARKLVRHHEHVPVMWDEYVRRLPGWVVLGQPEVIVSSSFQQQTIDAEAESFAASLGDDINALWSKRRLKQAERMVLWAKIAFRSVADMELFDQPLYRFELKSGATPLDLQRTETLKAAVHFVRLADHLAGQAHEAVDGDLTGVSTQWHKRLSTARLQMQDKIFSQALLALDAYKPETETGQLITGAKRLTDLAQTIVDAQRAFASADAAEDDEEADASRAQLQQALSETAGAVVLLDKAINKAATVWGIAGVPGVKAIVADLPDLDLSVAAGAGNVPPPPVVVVSAAPSASANIARTEMVGNKHSAAFEEMAPAGAVLVGFDLTTGKTRGAVIITSARPIYRGPAGETLGKQLGEPGGAVTRVIARPGYGVVGVDLHFGAKHMQNLILHFMRIENDTAIPSDNYDAPAFGGAHASENRIGVDKPVIGVFGEAGARIDKLGLILRN